jgi:hypothetical protein
MSGLESWTLTGLWCRLFHPIPQGISISLNGEWLGKEWPKDALTLSPGEHTIRVVCVAKAIDKREEQSVSIVSNSVKVEVVE